MRRPQTHGDDIRALGMLKGKKHLAKHCIPSAEACLPCHSGDVFPRRSCCAHWARSLVRQRFEEMPSAGPSRAPKEWIRCDREPGEM